MSRYPALGVTVPNLGKPEDVTPSESDNLPGLVAILVLSIVLVSGLLLWHPWSTEVNAWSDPPPAAAPASVLT